MKWGARRRRRGAARKKIVRVEKRMRTGSGDGLLRT